MASLARRFPDVKWDPNPIWVQDGRTYTSAGVSAGMDLALALIEEDLGGALALDVARRRVIYLRRPGSQSQFSVALLAQASERNHCRSCRRGLPRIWRTTCRWRASRGAPP